MKTRNLDQINRDGETLKWLYETFATNPDTTTQYRWFKALKWLATADLGGGHFTVLLPNKMTIVSDDLGNVNGKLPAFKANKTLTFAPNFKEGYDGANMKFVTHNEDLESKPAYPAYKDCTKDEDKGYCMVFDTSVTFQGVNISTNMKKQAGANLIKVKSGTNTFKGLGMEYFRQCTAITCSGGNLIVEDVNFKNAAGGTNIRFYNTNNDGRPFLKVEGSNLFHTGSSSTCVKIGVADNTSDQAGGNIGDITVDGNVADIGGSLLYMRPKAISIGKVNVVNNSVTGDVSQEADSGITSGYAACVYVGAEENTRPEYENLNIIGNNFFLDGSKAKKKVVAIYIENRPRFPEDKKKAKVKIAGIFYVNNSDKKDFPIIIPEDIVKRDAKMFIAGVVMSMSLKKKDNKYSGVEGIGLLKENGAVERLDPDDKIKRTKLYINAV